MHQTGAWSLWGAEHACLFLYLSSHETGPRRTRHSLEEAE